MDLLPKDAGMLSQAGEESVPAVARLKDDAGARFAAAFKASVRRFTPRSLLSRLILIVLAIDGLAAALTGAVIIYQARSATVVEVKAAMRVAEILVTDTIGLMKDAQASLLLQTIDLHFQSVRHVRLSVTDLDGRPVQASRSIGSSPSETAFTQPPAWFGRLIAPDREVKVMPVLLRNRLVGNVTITSEPSDEIGEAWHYAHALLGTGFCLSLVVLFVLTLLFGRVLAPLTALAAGLKGLEGRDYAIRLPRPSLRELAVITDHFNRTAEALLAASAANRLLNRKLVTAQDDERRRTALELHDEVGPCLFALDVNANSIANLTKDSGTDRSVHERALDVVGLVKQVQGINRRVLDSLRPMGLGRIPLRECLIRLIVDFSDKPGPRIDHAIDDLAESYAPILDLTIYRCMQEGLFNAIRHAQASRIRVRIGDLDEPPEPRRIEIEIADDGRGLAAPQRSGIGLTGMRERVEALGGVFQIETSGKGTRLMISLRVDPEDASSKTGARRA